MGRNYKLYKSLHTATALSILQVSITLSPTYSIEFVNVPPQDLLHIHGYCGGREHVQAGLSTHLVYIRQILFVTGTATNKSMAIILLTSSEVDLAVRLYVL